MAPEQMENRPEKASDIYSLGVIMYELFTGRLPFEGNAVNIMLSLLAREQFPRPRELNPDVPPALEAICMRYLLAGPARTFMTIW